MLACFVGKAGAHRIDYVFSEGRRERVEHMIQVLPEVVCSENLDTWRAYLCDVEVMIGTWGMEAWNEQVLKTYFPRLKAVFYAAGSVQTFARPFLKRGVAVVSAWGAMATPVAEMTLALILQTAKGFFHAERSYRQQGYQVAHDLATMCFPGSYDGTRVGILGAGMIGRRVIELLRPFDVQIWVYDPYLSAEKARQLGVKMCELEGIFERCSVISNHIANNAQTAGLLNYTHFSRMGKTTAFINTGRGAQVVEADLCRALQEEPLRCAVLDVTEKEPYPPDGPLRQLDNVVILPHIAGYAASEVHRLSDCVLAELKAYLRGDALRYQVTSDMLVTMA